MTYFFDNNLAPKLVRILRQLDIDARHLRTHFSADAKDEDWLPEVARQGWVVMTCDRGIRAGDARREVFRRGQVRAVLLRGCVGLRLIEQLGWLLTRWRDIDAEVQRRAQRGTKGMALRVPRKGKIESW